MTKIFDLLSLNGEMYMVDKEAKGFGKGWEIFEGQLNLLSDDVEATNRVIAATDKSLNLPVLPAIPYEQSFEEKILSIVKSVFVKGQDFKTAVLFRDAQKNAMERSPKPKQVEVEMEEVETGDIDHDEGGTLPGAVSYELEPIIENGFVKVRRWIYE